MADQLPPGLHWPRAVQTAGLVARPVAFLEACRARFGPTFTVRALRVGDLVFISDPPSLKGLFSGDRHNTLPPGRNVVLAPMLGSRSLLLLEGGEHLRRRRLMLPPFHGERMRAYESLIERAAQEELSRWPEARAFPLHPSMQAITLEVILGAVFGVGEQRRDELRRRLVAILAATRSPVAIGVTIPGVRRLPPFGRVFRLLAETDRLLASEISERRADPDLEGRDDILSMLVAARDEDGSSLSDGELRDQLMTLLMAGHETTATALAWTFDMLMHSPATLERLIEELEAGRDEYLGAVIDEALRLRPVVPFTGRQLSEPAHLGGHDLPAGAIVMAGIYLAHTAPDVYPEPYSFRPERFLEGGPKGYAWIPFGGGTRRCLGATFAEFEMRVVLRTVLSRATLRPADPNPERAIRRNVTISPERGTRVVLVDRTG